MTLAELAIDATSSSAAARAVFVRCKRQPDEGSEKPFLRVDLACGPHLWRTDVHEKHKPAVLDCSASSYLSALEAAFTIGSGSEAAAARFSYKWSSDSAVLTLMEHAGSGFAMKYASLSFEPVEGEEHMTQHWQELLHEIVVHSQHRYNETTRQRERIVELEGMLSKKDALLETAMTAKQTLEDELFSKFCAVLNAKKEEVERLQRALAIVQAKASTSTAYQLQKTTTAKKRAPPTGRKKPTGARLAKTAKTRKGTISSEDDGESDGQDEIGEEEEDSRDDSDHSGGEDGEKEDDDESRPTTTKLRGRVKREAIDAYSQLASQLQTPSQARAAADVLDDLDDILQAEEEQDEAAPDPARRRKRPAPSLSTATAAATGGDRSQEKKLKVAPTIAKPAPLKETPKPKPASPLKETMDSEEEDILDMLS